MRSRLESSKRFLYWISFLVPYHYQASAASSWVCLATLESKYFVHCTCKLNNAENSLTCLDVCLFFVLKECKWIIPIDIPKVALKRHKILDPDMSKENYFRNLEVAFLKVFPSSGVFSQFKNCHCSCGEFEFCMVSYGLQTHCQGELPMHEYSKYMIKSLGIQNNLYTKSKSRMTLLVTTKRWL